MEKEFDSHIKTAEKTMEMCKIHIDKAAKAIVESYKNNGKLMICGNGGSASDAQHFAGELVGRFKIERKALPAIALTENSSVLTAISNDYGYEKVFERQIEAIGEKGDVLVAITTSGNSQNVLNAVKKAKELGLKTIGLVGKRGGKLKGVCDIEILVPSEDTQRIQEMHVTIIHIICGIIENELFE